MIFKNDSQYAVEVMMSLPESTWQWHAHLQNHNTPANLVHTILQL